MIQTHPFRENTPLCLFHRCVHAVEVINAKEIASYELAKLYCEHYGLIPFAGSDNHTASRQTVLAGICCQQPITSIEDFMEKVRSRQVEIFSADNTAQPKEESLCI